MKRNSALRLAFVLAGTANDNNTVLSVADQ